MAGSGGKRYLLVIRSGGCSNGQVRTVIDDNVTGGAGVCSTASYADGFWHHAAGVRDGNSLRLYIDGVEQTPNSPVDITGVLSLDDPRPFTSGILWDFNAGPGTCPQGSRSS